MEANKSDRVSLYDIVYPLREEESDEFKGPISRLLYVCSINDVEKGQKWDIEESTKKIMTEAKEKYTELTDLSSEFTGYLQIKGNYAVHFLESDSQLLNLFLKLLHDLELKKEKPMYSQINIVAFTEENPNRFYPFWLSESVLSSPPGDMDRNEQQISERTFQVYNMFCQTGPKVKSMQTQNMKLASEVALNGDDLYMFMQKRFMGLSEYYTFYLEDNEMEIDLDTEHLFPYTPSLTRVLEFNDVGELMNLVD